MTVRAVSRMRPKKYAEKCGITVETVYAWVRNDTLPIGATYTRTPTNRLIIHVDENRHPPTPLLTETR